ncbi:hypothetical protein [uncultured Winogradskyella sp.]|uniref:hypothetical protein n=1 Tax=uncultured Winogradskyella sp. TaxID=395353 RepID=UPI0030DCFA44
MKKILFVGSADKQRSKTASDYFFDRHDSIEFDFVGTNHKICNKQGAFIDLKINVLYRSR